MPLFRKPAEQVGFRRICHGHHAVFSSGPLRFDDLPVDDYHDSLKAQVCLDETSRQLFWLTLRRPIRWRPARRRVRTTST